MGLYTATAPVVGVQGYRQFIRMTVTIDVVIVKMHSHSMTDFFLVRLM